MGHPSLGFVAGSAYLGKGIVSTVAISLAFALYTGQMLQGIPPIGVHIIAMIAILVATAVNYRGLELNAQVLVGTLLVQLALLGTYVAFSIPGVKVENLAVPLGNGIFGILAAAWLDTLTEALGDMLAVTRVALAKGKEHELPVWLGAVHQRFKSPHHAVLALGLLCAALALLVNLRQVLEVANVFTIVWYSIVHWDSLQLTSDQRLVPPLVSWIGLAGCLALLISLPVWAIAAGGIVLALVFGLRWIVSRTAAAPGRTPTGRSGARVK